MSHGCRNKKQIKQEPQDKRALQQEAHINVENSFPPSAFYQKAPSPSHQSPELRRPKLMCLAWRPSLRQRRPKSFADRNMGISTNAGPDKSIGVKSRRV